MTWYTFFKSLHVVAAAVWVGGAFIIQAYAFRILRSNDARRTVEFSKDTEMVSMRVFIPTTWVLLLAAIGMMVNLDLTWGQNWVVLGLISWVLSFVAGAGFLGPESAVSPRSWRGKAPSRQRPRHASGGSCWSRASSS